MKAARPITMAFAVAGLGALLIVLNKAALSPFPTQSGWQVVRRVVRLWFYAIAILMLALVFVRVGRA